MVARTPDDFGPNGGDELGDSFVFGSSSESAGQSSRPDVYRRRMFPLRPYAIALVAVGCLTAVVGFPLPWITVQLSTGGIITFLLSLLPDTLRKLAEAIPGLLSTALRPIADSVSRQVGGSITSTGDVVFAPSGLHLASGVQISFAGTVLGSIWTTPFVIIPARPLLWLVPVAAFLTVVTAVALWAAGRNALGTAVSGLCALLGLVVVGLFWYQTRSLPSQFLFIGTISYGLGFWMVVAGFAVAFLGAILGGISTDGPAPAAKSYRDHAA